MFQFLNQRMPSSRTRTSRRRPIESLERRDLLTAQLLISEFVANNGASLLDGHGDSPDWIEIHNAGDEAANLQDYYLSDDVNDLTKWRFPSGATLDAGAYTVVFASGLNAPDPNGNLHLNFRLGENGEHVVLSTADRIVSQFSPDGSEYPKQFRDVSYGIGDVVPAISFVDSKTVSQFYVPNSNDLGTSWTDVDFNHTPAWQVGGNGIGFDSNGAGGTILQLDFNDDDSGESGAQNVEEGWSSFSLSDNGTNYGGITVNVSGIGGVPLDDRDRSTPTDAPPEFTYDQIYDDFIFARSQTDGTGIEIALSGLVAGQAYDVTFWSYDNGSVDPRVSNWNEVSTGVAIPIENNYSFDGRDTPNSNSDHSFAARLTASDSGTLQIEGRRNGGTSFGVFVNALQIAIATSADLIATDISPAMAGRTSAMARFPFSVNAPDSVESLSLTMQYDSGFVAYLNGTEIARSNVAGAGIPVFDSVSTIEKRVDDTLQPETFDISSSIPTLRAGSNVLAVYGFNSSAGDSDFLIRPQLSATGAGQQPLYYTTPTPGAENNTAGVIGYVTDTTFSVDRGFYTEPFDLEIRSSTEGASIIYTTDGSIPTENNGTIVTAANSQAPPIAVIRIDKTSYVRAVAMKDGVLSSNVDTQTYLFLENVIRQDPTNDPDAPSYPDRWQANAIGDYEMDPEVVAQWDDNDPDNADFGIREALMSIPTMSIVMEHDDLWDSSQGIYRNSTQRGERFRRAASIEYFDPNTGEEFQVNAGIQVHGGASRDNERLKKHSLRLLFRNDFGEPTLNFPLFSDTDNEEFNTLVLRACFTDAFATRSVIERYNPIESQYTRDVWMKDTLFAMGNISTHNTYVHLYLNGLYWGLYNPAERPDNAFLSTYLGGEREDWDIIKDFNELFAGSRTAWQEMFTLARELSSSDDPEAIFFQLQGRNPDGTRNDELPNYLDMENLIDYMILHLYAGVEDWPHHNWYAGRNRVGDEGFKFFVWDQEIALDPRYRDRTDVGRAGDHRFTPAELYDLLRRNSEEFRLLFADRVQKHFAPDGALAIANSQARWMARSNEIEKAIIGESARWGDAREGERITIQSGTPAVTVPTMTVNEWREERDKVRDIYIPENSRLFLERIAEIDLTTQVNAPVFDSPEGVVAAGTQLSITAPQDQLVVRSTLMPEFSPATAFVPRDGSLDGVNGNAPIWTAVNFDDSGWISGNGGVGFDNRTDYDPLIGIDLESEDLPQAQRIDGDGDGQKDSPSVYTRFEIPVDAGFDASNFDRLLLNVKYDDGFIAYLNGTQVHSQFGPDDPTWDARATTSHEAEANEFEEFDISEFLSLLRPGEKNILAIHAFNRSQSSSDFVISPELSLGSLQDVTNAPVYYTTDGSDPRLPGGNVNPNAREATSPIVLDDSVQIRARAQTLGLWSAESASVFVVNPPSLAITEIHFNPAQPSIDEIAIVPAAVNDDFEFIELHNTNTNESINLLGLQLSNGVDFAFPDQALAPGEFAVVVANQQLFEARYGTDIRVLGQYTGRLANGGERLSLASADDEVLLTVDFADGDPWPVASDGVGASLELISPSTLPAEYSKYYRWQSSTPLGGTPGMANSSPVGIVVNEVLARTRPGVQVDAIELYNTTGAPVNIGGWFLSDSDQNLFKFEIPAGTTIAANAYVVFTESDFNPTPNAPLPNHFALDGTGRDDVWLTQRSDDGTVSDFVDDVHFRASADGESWGRVPNGQGRLAPIANPTFGAANSDPRVGGVVISEIGFAPAEPSPAALAVYPDLDASDLEFLEIYNSGDAVDLNGWQIRGGIDFDYDESTPLSTGETVVVIPFNPDREDNASRLAAFRTYYQLGDDVRVIGGYQGSLANEGERIVLLRPDSSAAPPISVLAEEVIYDDRTPWPNTANGESFHRVDANRYANDFASWDASAPNPGVAVFDSAAFDVNGDGTIDINDVDRLCSSIANGEKLFDLTGDGNTDGNDVARLLAVGLSSVVGDVNSDGIFDSADLVKLFQVREYEDGIDGNSLWSEGDWNCDGDFSSADLVVAFQAGTYRR
ncbi:MAG: lamin tail domain-containing protein [Planctomycetales bacterium]|nr:lamin tail domain-containing protein [Planctomycetales bacterium]